MLHLEYVYLYVHIYLCIHMYMSYHVLFTIGRRAGAQARHLASVAASPSSSQTPNIMKKMHLQTAACRRYSYCCSC